MVLVHLESNDIFTLNQTAAALWRLLPECNSLDELVERLFETFAVDRRDLEREVGEVLSTLCKAGLVRLQ